MPLAFFEWAALTILAYLGAGVVSAAVSQFRGLDSTDPDVVNGSRVFRILMTPGLVLLWPLVLGRGLSVAPYTEPHDAPGGGNVPVRRRQFGAAVLMIIAALTVLSLGFMSIPTANSSHADSVQAAEGP
jgi:hypothetical protein